MKIIFDLEADGLIEECTKIHCFCYYNVDTKESTSLTDYNDIIDVVTDPSNTVIGHNIIRFDIPVLEKLLEIKVNCKAVDTLALSWYLFPERPTHNLNDWGVSFGVEKPKIEDWDNLPIEEYIHRCEEDVKINTKLWDIQELYLNDLYEGDYERLIGYLSFKLDCAREQEQVKWKLDVQQCRLNYGNLVHEKEEKKIALTEAMPLAETYKTVNKPKKLYRKDGTYSTIGEKWFKLLEELGYPEDFDLPLQLLKDKSKGNPNSSTQLKEWLFSLGWEPETFKYIKEPTDTIRKVPQINLPFGQGICDSIKRLYEKEPALENLDKYSVLSHRIGILKGFLRDEVNGYLKAQVKGLTNTLRFQHTELVNLPGVATQYGEYIRSVLICESNQVLCGADMSSLEDRTKQHYMYFFDPEYVESMIKPGFDPHLDLAEFAYNLTNGEMGCSPEDIEFFKNFKETDDKSKYKKIKGERHSFKTVNYAAVYGSGAATMSRGSGMSIPRCEILIDAYWKKNWAVKEVSNNVKIKTIGDQMWLFNPVSTVWYSLRYKKDIFSTLNQGTGVYCFDYWVRKCRERGVKLTGQFHDEIITVVFDAPFDREQMRIKMRDAINEVNEILQLNRELDIDVQFGKNYSLIH